MQLGHPSEPRAKTTRASLRAKCTDSVKARAPKLRARSWRHCASRRASNSQRGILGCLLYTSDAADDM
eukprot:381109-Alexandrium_andersonii.AAC.1